MKNRLLRWLLLGLLLWTIIGCSSRTPTEFPDCYQIPPVTQTTNTAVRSWFDGVEPIFVGFGMGTAFAVGLDDDHVYWMTAYHVVEKARNVRIGVRRGTVIALERIQDLAIVRTDKGEGWGRIHRFAMATVGDLAIGVGHSKFFGKAVTMIHIGNVVSKDFPSRTGQWQIVTNGGARGGMSGGPLFNRRRGVIGVCSFFADTGIDRHANPSEIAYVPGIVAGMFWNHVQKDLIAANAVNTPQEAPNESQ